MYVRRTSFKPRNRNQYIFLPEFRHTKDINKVGWPLIGVGVYSGGIVELFSFNLILDVCMNTLT